MDCCGDDDERRGDRDLVSRRLCSTGSGCRRDNSALFIACRSNRREASPTRIRGGDSADAPNLSLRTLARRAAAKISASAALCYAGELVGKKTLNTTAAHLVSDASASLRRSAAFVWSVGFFSLLVGIEVFAVSGGAMKSIVLEYEFGWIV